MAVVFHDQFTRASDTQLHLHTPTDAGDSWTKMSASDIRSINVIAATDIARPSNSENPRLASYTADVTGGYGSDDYDIELDIVGLAGAATYASFVGGRVTDDANFDGYYCVFYNPATGTDMYLTKRVGGSITDMASGDIGMAAGDALKFSLSGSSLKSFVNAVEKLSTTDSDIASGGTGCLGAGFVRVASQGINTTHQYDNFIITTTGAAGPYRYAGKLVNVGRMLVR